MDSGAWFEGRPAFGRYRILDRLGGGAEGVIYRAYDPQLEREVALKFPRFEPGAVGERQRARLLREAEALARLAHPNVVAVYDVQVQGDEVCLVCEYVRGLTVDRWLSHMPRTPRQIMGVFRDAGRGLAAVHEAGLVHRDFKPANVIVGRDGRVRVVDFGLARSDRDFEEELETQAETARMDTMSALPSLTLTGALVGTPLYMSPEQHSGMAVDPRADQWAFCMALAEALLGRYPLPKDDLYVLAVAKRKGIRLKELPAGVPRGWRRPIERGLRRDPARRFASMEDLLAALERPSPPLGRRLLALAGGVGVASAVASLSWSAGDPLNEGICDQAEGLDSVWNGSRRQHVRAALLELDEPHVTDTLDRTRIELDGFASAWWMHWNQACADADSGVIDAETLRAEQSCLESLALELDATLSTVEEPTPETSRNLLSAVQQLSPPAGCSTPRRRARWRDRPSDPSRAESVDEAYAVVAEAVALQRLGENGRALQLLTDLRDDAVDHPPLQLEIRYHWGRVATDLGRYHEAVAPLTSAYFEAEALGEGYEWIALNAAMSLAEIHGVHRASGAGDAETWIGYADAMSRRLSDRDPRAPVNVELLRATTLVAAGRFEEAVEPLREVVEDYDGLEGEAAGHEAFGPRQNLAVALLQSGYEDEAIQELQTIVGQMGARLGPAHPSIVPVLLNLGAACEAVNDEECTERTYERLEPLVRHYHEGTSALSAAFAYGMGGVHARQERFRIARRYRIDALAAAMSVYGEHHTQTAIMAYGLAVVELELGERTSAKANLRRARDTFGQQLGPANPYAASVEVALARVEFELGNFDAAYEHAEAVGDLAESASAPSRGVAQEFMGLVAMRRGRPQAGQEHFDAALQLLTAATGVDSFESRRVQAERASAMAEAEAFDSAQRALIEVRSAATSPSFTPRQRALLQLRAADVALRLGQRTDARGLVDEATRQSLRAPASTEMVRQEISAWRERTGV